MPGSYLIGVDLGTSATKAALYRADGTLVGEATEPVPLGTLGAGMVEQDSDDFYRTAASTVRRVVSESGIDPNSVAAIGFDSQMAGIGSVDETFRPATHFDSWLDMRCKPYIEALARDHGADITRITGCPPTCAHAAKMLWWRHERPDDYARIAKFVVPSAYVAGRLAGIGSAEAFIDHTFLHFSGCADSEAGSWSDLLCDRLGIDRGRLPRIEAPESIVGESHPDAAGDFGLPPGIPIVAGAGDTAASALGAGIVRPGMVLDVAGTASVLTGCTDRFAPDVENRVLLVMRSAAPGLWHPLAYVGGGGLALTWFRDHFADSGRKEAPDAVYERLVEEAAAVSPGAEGLLFSPHLGGRICPADPARRGSWTGFSWNHRRAHFVRSILESIAFEYASYLAIIEALTPHIGRLEARVVGGGARSRAWNKIKADVLDMPYRRLSRSDIATWGVAIIAGHAAGLIPDIAAAAAAASDGEGEAVLPDPKTHESYLPIIERYVAWQRSMDRA